MAILTTYLAGSAAETLPETRQAYARYATIQNVRMHARLHLGRYK